MEHSAARFRGEIYDEERFPWKTFGGDMLGMYQEAFGVTSPYGFRSRLIRPTTTAALLTDGIEIAGFSIAVPIGDELIRRKKDSATTAFVAPTVIKKKYRGLKIGLVRRLLGTMDDELRRKGYQYVERHAQTAQGYADALEKIYGERVVFRRNHPTNPYRTPLRTLRMRL